MSITARLSEMKMDHPSCGSKSVQNAERVDVVPTVYSLFLQIFGYCPYTLAQRSRNPKARVSSIFLTITILVFAILTIFIVPYIGANLIIYESELEKLEFFTIIAFTFRTYIFVQGPLLLLATAVKFRQLPRIITLVQCLVEEFSVGSRRKARFLIYAVCCANALVVALSLTAFCFNFVPAAKLFSAAVAQFTGITVPPFATSLMNAFCLLLCALGEVFPLGVQSILLLYLGMAFGYVKAAIKNLALPEMEKQPPAVLDQLTKLRRRYGQLQCCVVEVDELFNPISFLLCVREVIGMVGALGALLQVPDDEKSGGITIGKTTFPHAASKSLVIWYGIWGVCNMAIRMAITISCHERAQSVRPAIKNLDSHYVHPEVQAECRLFVSQCEPTDGSVSCGGFFRLNKDHLLTVFGMLATYTILIYQARDSKMDMADLMDKQDYSKLVNLIKNVSDWNPNSTTR